MLVMSAIDSAAKLSDEQSEVVVEVAQGNASI